MDTGGLEAREKLVGWSLVVLRAGQRGQQREREGGKAGTKRQEEEADVRAWS